MTNTSAPMVDWNDPECTWLTMCHWTCLNVKAMKTMVSTPVKTVMTACMRMIRSKPITPPPVMRAATTNMATTLVASPPFHPSRVKTVDVARTAMTVRAVSQPTHRSHEIPDGRRLPRTP